MSTKLRLAAASGSPETMPSKLYFRIGEVAGLVGVEPHVLRYWEREFRAIRPTKSSKGQRVYSRRDVENLLRVRTLLYEEGFTIAGARKKLSRKPGEGDAAPAPESATPASATPASGERPTHRNAQDATELAPPSATEPTQDALVSAAIMVAATPAGPPPEAAPSMLAVRASLHELRDELELLLDELGGD